MAENRTKTTRLNLFLQLVFAFIIFLGVNLLGNATLGPYRLDLTGDKLFTLSEGTGPILEALERPITLKFYFSESNAAGYPELYRYGQRVEDFLREFEVLADGMITLEKYDPEAYTPEKTEAQAYGLLNLGGGDDDPFFLGLVGFDDTNRLEVISRFSEDRERFLEYDLAKNIYLLAQAERPTLGIISGLPLQFGVGGAMAVLQGQSQSYLLYSQLGQFFNLEHLESEFSTIPGTVDVLMVLHPPRLTDRQLFAIDQFVLSGNPAIVFVDPFAEVSPTSGQNGAVGVGEVINPSSDFKPLLEAWGVGYSPDLAVIDLELAQRVEVALEAGTSLQDYVHWLGVDKARLNENDPVTAFLTVVNFASAGALIPMDKDGLRFDPLISTSENAALIDADLIRGNNNASRLTDEFIKTQSFTLSARISGLAQSAFPDGVEGLSGLKEGQINVVVTADADIFEDRFWAAIRQEATGQNVLVPIADNAAFIVNAIDHLGGSEGLVSLRARGVSKRPLEKFQELRREATRIEKAEQDILRQRLIEAQSRLSDLETGAGGEQISSQTKEAALRDFRNEIRILEKNINLAQRNLQLSIKGLENRVIFLNMFIIPVGLIFLTLLRFGILRRGRKKS